MLNRRNIVAGAALSAMGFRVHASAPGVAITGVKIYPAPGERPIIDGVVLIRGSQIVAVGRRASLAAPAGYRVLERPGEILTAGFWNCHVHLTHPAFLRYEASPDSVIQAELDRAFTRWGFTTIFDLASTMAIASDLKLRLRRGRVQGPRLLSVGDPFYPQRATPIYAQPLYREFSLPSAEVTSTAAAARRAAVQIRNGADAVKLFTGSIMGGPESTVHMDADTVRAITDAAHRLGKRVFAHPTDEIGLQRAIHNGVDVLAHTMPLAGAWSPQYARGLVKRRVALVPTLGLFASANNPATPVETALQQTRSFAEAGGQILFGTDAGFTEMFDTSEDMRLMHEAIGWERLLASLTTIPAHIFGHERRLGRVAAGMEADLVLLGSDPARDATAMSDVRMTVGAGRILFGA
jgi:imidazolonepropionase-like amidohydrolase